MRLCGVFSITFCVLPPCFVDNLLVTAWYTAVSYKSTVKGFLQNPGYIFVLRVMIKIHNSWKSSLLQRVSRYTVYPKKYAHGFCFAVLCCGYTLTDFPISIRLTSLALWQSNDCPSASKATLMNMDKYFMWIHYERLHYHNKAKHNKTVCIFLGVYCTCTWYKMCYCAQTV